MVFSDNRTLYLVQVKSVFPARWETTRASRQTGKIGILNKNNEAKRAENSQT